MSKPVNIVLEKYDSEELAKANELIGDMLINANIENKRLKAENAKLRELVQEIYEDQCCDGDCWKYRDRMCELGIEVGR